MLRYKIRYTTDQSLWQYQDFKDKESQTRYIEQLEATYGKQVEIVKIGFMNLLF